MIPFRTFEIEGVEEIQRAVLGFLQDLPRVFRRETGANLNKLVHKDLLSECPCLADVLAPYGLKCVEAYAFVMYDQASCSIHSDAIPQQARLNIPILNCEGTLTKFYECEKQIQVPHFTGVKVFNYFGCREVASVEVTQPTLLRVSMPHYVALSPGQPLPRITISLGFDRDPVFLLDET
jgi:hypothetical protein